MFSLFRRKPKTRQELVLLGDQARARGRVKKAINHYQAALVLAPDDATIHGKLAPLLAKTQQGEAALNSFKAAADGHVAKGFTDRAISVWTQAAGSFPNQPRIWQELSRLQLGRGRRADALKALIDGRAALKRKGERAEAAVLLRQVLELESGHVDARLDLAGLMGKLGQRDEALALLTPLEDGPPKVLKRVRKTQFWIAPSPGRLWRWFRT